MKEENEDIDKMRKEIAIERLRQAPPTIKVSFGATGGEFLDKDEMIQQIEKGTELGKRIVNVQLEYLKAFKRAVLVEG